MDASPIAVYHASTMIKSGCKTSISSRAFLLMPFLNVNKLNPLRGMLHASLIRILPTASKSRVLEDAMHTRTKAQGEMLKG
jgi:hypothetical protein